jgi:thiol-disulfide isomerase/thioredoxin/chitodextrinase
MFKIRAIILVLVLFFSLIATVPAIALTGPGDGPVPVAEAPSTTTDRVVLVELITAGWCPTCPDADGALVEMEDAYPRDQLVILAYHRSDALSNDDGDARQAFYANPYQPDAYFDGMSHVRGSKGSVSANRAAYEAEVDARLAIPSPLVLTVEGWTDTTTGQGVAYVNVTALSDPGFDDLKLHVAVFEDDFGPWNGGNGVKQHDWLTRDLLTGPDGQDITLAALDSKSFSFTYDATGYAQDLDQVGVLAFIQSAGATKEVVQAGYMKEHITTPTNTLPELTNHGVTPDVGNTSTTFRYQVDYRDADNDRPVKAQVFIDDVAYDLQADTDGPFTDWTNYYHETPLTVGDDHTYRFVFSDGTAELRIPDPTTGPDHFVGPTVDPPTSAPTLALASVEPQGGDALRERTFSVVYTDGEGDVPTIAHVVIDGVAHDMIGQGTNFQLGVTFTYSTLLPAGDHEYHFSFGDGIHGARLPASDEAIESVVPDLQGVVVLASHAQDGEVVEGESVTLGFDDEGVPDGHIAAYSWESDIDGVLGQQQEVTFTPTLGNHEITLTVTTADGGEYSAKVHILSAEAMATPVVDDVIVSPEEPIEGDIVLFTVTVGNVGNVDVEDLVVRLLDASDDLLAFHSLTNPLMPDQTEKVTLEWESVEGAHQLTIEAGSDTRVVPVMVEENHVPLADIRILGSGQVEPAQVSLGERVHFIGIGADPEGEALTYAWNFGDGGTSEEVEPEHKFDKAGSHTVTLTVTDPRGGTSTATFEVEVTDGSTPGLAAFTILLVVLVSALVATVLRKR